MYDSYVLLGTFFYELFVCSGGWEPWGEEGWSAFLDMDRADSDGSDDSEYDHIFGDASELTAPCTRVFSPLKSSCTGRSGRARLV